MDFIRSSKNRLPDLRQRCFPAGFISQIWKFQPSLGHKYWAGVTSSVWTAHWPLPNHSACEHETSRRGSLFSLCAINLTAITEQRRRKTRGVTAPSYRITRTENKRAGGWDDRIYFGVSLLSYYRYFAPSSCFTLTENVHLAYHMFYKLIAYFLEWKRKRWFHYNVFSGSWSWLWFHNNVFSGSWSWLYFMLALWLIVLDRHIPMGGYFLISFIWFRCAYRPTSCSSFFFDRLFRWAESLK